MRRTSDIPVNAERMRKLTRIGLTEAQARAYLALLDLGAAPAKDIATVGKVPKAKVYAALDALVAKGLAEVEPEHPKRYAPRPVDGYVASLARDLDSRAHDLRDRAPDLAREFRIEAEGALEPRSGFGVIRGRRGANARMLEMVAGARERVVVRASAGVVSRLARADRELASALDAGADVVVLAPPDASTRARSALAASARVEDADAPGDGDVSVVVVDGRVALIARSVPDDASFARGDDVAFWTRDPALARALEDLAAGRAWDTLAEALVGPRDSTQTL